MEKINSKIRLRAKFSENPVPNLYIIDVLASLTE